MREHRGLDITHRTKYTGRLRSNDGMGKKIQASDLFIQNVFLGTDLVLTAFQDGVAEIC